jgi:hypothetical protein
MIQQHVGNFVKDDMYFVDVMYRLVVENVVGTFCRYPKSEEFRFKREGENVNVAPTNYA